MNTDLIVQECYVCGGEAHPVRESREVSYGRRTVLVDDEHMRCAECGEQFYVPGQAEATDRRAADIVRVQGGILPFEIRNLRRKLGVTQEQFEDALGLGAKTITRWERGIVEPEGPTVALLRALDAELLSISDLIALRRVPAVLASHYSTLSPRS